MKTERIISPDSAVESIQAETVRHLAELFPGQTVEAIGSMAVPMEGRPEIDIMIVSESAESVEADAQRLAVEGFARGPIEKGIAYLKEMRSGIEIAVQIIPAGHKMIDIHHTILGKLSSDPALRTAYEQFKRTLEGLDKAEYKKRKSRWVEDNLLNQ